MESCDVGGAGGGAGGSGSCGGGSLRVRDGGVTLG